MTFLCICAGPDGAIESSCRPRAVADFLTAHNHALVRVEAVHDDTTTDALDRHKRVRG